MDRCRFNEASSGQLTGTIVDQAGVAIIKADLVTATLTLLDAETYVPGVSPAEGIINSRDEQNVLDANHVTIHATSGLFTWSVQPADNLIVTARRQIERHRAEFHFTWSSGEFWYRCEIEVMNLHTPA